MREREEEREIWKVKLFTEDILSNSLQAWMKGMMYNLD